MTAIGTQQDLGDGPVVTAAGPPARLSRGRVADLPAGVAGRDAIEFRERRWVPLAMYLGDVASLQLALLLGWAVHAAIRPWFGFGGLRAGEYGSLAAVMAILPLVFFAVGMYPGYGRSVVERLRRRVQTILVIFALLIVWHYLLAPARVWRGVEVKTAPSRGVLGLTFAFAVVLCPMVAALMRAALIQLRCWGRPCVVLGAGETGSLLVRLLRREPELGLVPIGAFDDDPAKWGKDLDKTVPILGPVSNAKALPGQRPLKLALIAMPSVEKDRIAHLCNRLPYPRVIVIPDLLGVASLWVQTRDLGGIVGLEVKRKLLARKNWFFKRCLDYGFGVPMLLVALPVIGLFALWIKRVSPGPALFRQERVGFGGKPMRVWKLRTMWPDAEARLQRTLEADPALKAQWEHNFKLREDPRVLPGVGKLLRRTSLDELPQLFNVMKGEMSLVGPRPFPRYHLDKFRPSFRTTRRSVLPGITGLWQVTERADADPELQELLDTYYVRNWSIWLDLHVLFKTVQAVLIGRGAY